MLGKRKGNSKMMPLFSEQVRRLVGPVSDNTLLAILECNASAQDLPAAVSYLGGEGSLPDGVGHPLAGTVAQLYDILSTDRLCASADEN